jgi:DNA invertase Pin-like site-specific DNA recombinase
VRRRRKRRHIHPPQVGLKSMFYGYARVSTAEQNLDLQVKALREAGCTVIFEEKVSGTVKARPELSRLLSAVKRGDTVVFWKLDRLGRSAQHLLEIANRLTADGVALRCLTAPIDTGSPAGTLMLQLLAAFAEFERNLNSERTKAGLVIAAAKGRVSGNPALRRHDPAAVRQNREIQHQLHFERINRTAHRWLPIVRQMRPEKPWDHVVRALNARLEHGDITWTREKLRRAVGRFVKEGLAAPELLGRAEDRHKDDRLLAIVAGMKSMNRDATLRDIAAQLDRMQERPPRGGNRWRISSIKLLVDRAARRGMLSAPT